MEVEFNKNKKTGGLRFTVEFTAGEALEAGVIDQAIKLGRSANASYEEIMPLISEVVIAIASAPSVIHKSIDLGEEITTIPLKDLSREGIAAVSRVGTIMSTACSLGICDTCKGEPCQHACHAN